MKVEYFKNFNWAVPVAFSSALADCRFEEGDRFFDSEKAYLKWEKAIQYINYDILLTFPSQASSTALPKEDKKKKTRYWRFKYYWDTEIRLQLTNYKSKNIKHITSTQGRFYMFLWKGKFEILDITSKKPDPPLLVGETRKIIVESKIHFSEYFENDINTYRLFIFAYDPTNEVSFNKLPKIEKSFDKDFEYVKTEQSPYDFNLPTEKIYAPTVSIICFKFIKKNIHEGDVIGALKRALYKHSNDKQKVESRFSVKSHGLLI